MVEVAEKQFTSKQRSKIERQMLSLRASLWPKADENSIWHYKSSQGWLSMPRALPHILLAMDNLSKGKPLSSTYLDLWCRTYDNSFVITNKPREMAFCSGFSGERAEHTWASRIQILAKLGFIDCQAGPSGPISYVLIYNPYHAIKRHGDSGALDQATYNAVKQRMVEIGALDMEDPAKQAGLKSSASSAKQMPKKKKKAEVTPVEFYLDLCIRARLVYADLDLIDKDLRKENRTGEHTMIMVKQSLISIKNLTDLLDENRLLSREFPAITEARSNLKKDLEFCAYIRSRYAGHVDKRVIAKAIEWKPELRWAIFENHEPASNLINLFILETTINTYVTDDGSHKIFEGDTDLNYPPDMERFLNFLARVLTGGKEIARQVIYASLNKLGLPLQQNSAEAMELFKLAGFTEFHFLPGRSR